MYRIFLTTTILFLGTTSLVHAAEDVYVIRKGETLSEIAAARIGRPIFTARGSLKRLLRWNPHIVNPHAVLTGQTIYLSERSARKPASADTEALETPSSRENAVAGYPVSRLGLDLGFEYFAVNAEHPQRHSDASVYSDMSPAAKFTWNLDWSEKWSTRARFSYISDKVSNGAVSTVTNGNGSRVSAYFGVVRHWGESNRTELSAGSESRLFIRSTSATNVHIDRIPSLELKGKHEIDLVTVNSAKLGVSLGAFFVNSAKGTGYSTKKGHGLDAGLFFQHTLRSNLELKAEAGYGQSWQNSTLLNQTEQNVGFFFGISKKFQ